VQFAWSRRVREFVSRVCDAMVALCFAKHPFLSIFVFAPGFMDAQGVSQHYPSVGQDL